MSKELESKLYMYNKELERLNRKYRQSIDCGGGGTKQLHNEIIICKLRIELCKTQHELDQIQNADLNIAEQILKRVLEDCRNLDLGYIIDDLKAIKQSLKKAKLVEEKLKILFNKKTTATNYLVTLNELEEMFEE